MNRIYLTFAGLILSLGGMYAQEQNTSAAKYVFTLDDVVRIAKEQSPNALVARHQFRASYFNFRAYKANYLPKLTFTTEPITYDHSIRSIATIDTAGKYQIREAKVNTLTSTAGLALAQKVGLTGGTVALSSGLTRTQNLDDNSNAGTQYTASPIDLGFTQPLNGYNELKWEKKIEPVRYEEAKQRYIANMEVVSSGAVERFFELVLAQISLNMAQTNYANSKELYEISKGRYQIGTIAEDALLQMELRYMQAESKLNQAKIDIESEQSQLRSFLGFKDNVEILLQIDPKVPSLKVPHDKALDLALTRSPEIILYNRRILEAEQEVARRKSLKGVTMSLSASFGLNKMGYDFKDAYTPKYDDRERVSVGITVPILDWNQAKDRYRNAQSELEVIETQMKQAETDFRQNIYLEVMAFNMQENQLRIAAKADTIAQKGYEVSRQRYLIGKVSVTDLNIADADKDEFRKSYITALKSYWTSYFTVRRLTLFDFLNNRPLEENLSSIVGE